MRLFSLLMPAGLLLNSNVQEQKSYACKLKPSTLSFNNRFKNQHMDSRSANELPTHPRLAFARPGKFSRKKIFTHPEHLTECLKQNNFFIIPSKKYQPNAALLANWVETVNQIYLKENKGASIHQLRWQRSFDPNQNTPRSCVNEKWHLLNRHNQNSKLQDLPDKHQLFHQANAYFNLLTDSLLTQLPTSKKIVHEIRYISSENNTSFEETLWHQDGKPILLTTSCTWLGPSTILKKKGVSSTLNNATQCDTEGLIILDKTKKICTTKPGDTLVFYGKSGKTPLWHKSPEMTGNRLILLLRIIDRPSNDPTKLWRQLP